MSHLLLYHFRFNIIYIFQKKKFQCTIYSVSKRRQILEHDPRKTSAAFQLFKSKIKPVSRRKKKKVVFKKISKK